MIHDQGVTMTLSPAATSSRTRAHASARIAQHSTEGAAIGRLCGEDSQCHDPLGAAHSRAATACRRTWPRLLDAAAHTHAVTARGHAQPTSRHTHSRSHRELVCGAGDHKGRMTLSPEAAGEGDSRAG